MLKCLLKHRSKATELMDPGIGATPCAKFMCHTWSAKLNLMKPAMMLELFKIVRVPVSGMARHGYENGIYIGFTKFQPDISSFLLLLLSFSFPSSFFSFSSFPFLLSINLALLPKGWRRQRR